MNLLLFYILFIILLMIPQQILADDYGNLPQSYLYKFKRAQDKIDLFLILDPQKKIEKLVKQSDTKIAALPGLIKQQEIQLANEIALKAGNDYTEINLIYNKTRTKPDQETFFALNKNSQKYQKILKSLSKHLDNNSQKTFLQVASFYEENQRQLRKMFEEDAVK